MSVFDIDPMSPIGPSFKTLLLERRTHALSMELGSFTRDSMELQQREAHYQADRMLCRLTADVLTEKLPPETINESRIAVWNFPRSSWQHFKLEHSESWWLGWLVRRRPVQYAVHDKQVTLTVDLERYRTFPQANIAYPPELGPYVNVAYLEKSWSEW